MRADKVASLYWLLAPAGSTVFARSRSTVIFMTTMNHDAVKLHNILNRSLTLLDDAGELVVRAGIRPSEATVQLLDHALGELQQVRNALYETEPALRPIVSAPVIASPAPAGPLPSVGIELYGP